MASRLAQDDLQDILEDLCEQDAGIDEYVGVRVRELLESSRMNVNSTPRRTKNRPASAPVRRSPSSSGAAARARPSTATRRTPSNRPRSAQSTASSAGARRRSRGLRAELLRKGMSTPVMSPMSKKLTEDLPPMMDRLPDKRPRVTAYKNGNEDDYVHIVARDFLDLLDQASTKLDLRHPAKRVFDHEGNEIFDVRALWADAKVYISCGEGFRDPFGSPVPWAVQDVSSRKMVTPKDWDEQERQQALTYGIHKTRVLVRRNGEPWGRGDLDSPPKAVVCRTQGDFDMIDEMDLVLQECTNKLGVSNPVTRLFDDEGTEIKSTRRLEKDQLLYASLGENFREPQLEDPLPWVPEDKFSNRRVTTEDDTYFSRDKNLTAGGVLNIRVRVKRNGDKSPDFVWVVARGEGEHCPRETAMQLWLEDCTHALGLPRNATKLYHESGAPVTSTKELQKGETIYVSMGERFRRPDDLDPMPWMGGHKYTVLPPRGTHKKDREISRKRTRRFFARINGDTKEQRVVVAHPVGRYSVDQCMGILAGNCTEALGIPSACRRLFVMRQDRPVEVTKDNYHEELFGQDVNLMDDEEKILYVSMGEPFRRIGKLLPWTHREAGTTKRITKASLAGTHRLVKARQKMRLQVFRNGRGKVGDGRIIVGRTFEQLLEEAATALGLNQAARRFYSAEGKRLRTMEDLHAVDCDHILVSVGETFKREPSPDNAAYASFATTM